MKRSVKEHCFPLRFGSFVRPFFFIINDNDHHHHHHHHRPFNFVFLVILPPAASSCSSSFSESILPTLENRCFIPIREMTRNRFLRTGSTVGYCFSFFLLSFRIVSDWQNVSLNYPEKEEEEESQFLSSLSLRPSTTTTIHHFYFNSR